MHVVERQYGLGNITQNQFLEWKFGCQYKVIDYLATNNLHGSVIDNWTIWHAPSVSFYSTNRFVEFSISPKEHLKNISKALSKSDIKFVYYDETVKNAFLADTQSFAVESKLQKLPGEELILKNSKLIYQDGSCKLFKINF